MKIVNDIQEMEKGEFAILRVDPNSGVPISESGEWLKKGELEYITFNSLIAARKFALENLKTDLTIEWMLFDSTNNLIETLHDKPTILKTNVVKKTWLKKFFE